MKKKASNFEIYSEWLERSTEAPETDSWDLYDHGVRPNDWNVATYQKKKSLRWVFTSHALDFWAVSKVSNDKDKGACWSEQL